MSNAKALTSIWSEPLLGFALAGGLVFLLYSLMAEPEQDAIVVTADMVTALDRDFQLLNGRPPSADERSALIQRYIDEEILVRAAYAEGLDRRDGRVRQQLISKMTFLIDEEPPEPGGVQGGPGTLHADDRHRSDPDAAVPGRG